MVDPTDHIVGPPLIVGKTQHSVPQDSDTRSERRWNNNNTVLPRTTYHHCGYRVDWLRQE
eukprot:scaffold15227_cov73-Skeletonema_dohrnii-CCMP3373.AAC.1